MPKIAFLTMDDTAGFFTYDHLVHEPLARRGWQVDDVSWRNEAARWDDYELVVIRSPWDYQQAADAFMAVLERIDRSRARLENDLATVRWNIHKTYLRDLRDRGIEIVPTCWLPRLDRASLSRLFSRLDTNRLVIKPTVGANADDTFLLDVEDRGDRWEVAERVFGDRELMAQPFVRSVVEVGEYSLFFFAGQYSHSVLKTPRPRDFRVQEEHGGMIRSVEPPLDLIAAAAAVLRVLDTEPLYARVDLVRLPGGAPALMELELIEPSLYFGFDRDSADRFAEAVVRRLT